jgi:hypothetical protein
MICAAVGKITAFIKSFFSPVVALIPCKCEFKYIIYANTIQPCDHTEVCIDCGKAEFYIAHEAGPCRGSFRKATIEVSYCEKGWLPMKSYYQGQQGPFVPFIRADGTRVTKEEVQELIKKGK